MWKIKIRKGKKKAQSTLEYVILVAAIVVVMLAFLGPTGVFQSTLNTTLDTTSNTMIKMADRIANSQF